MNRSHASAAALGTSAAFAAAFLAQLAPSYAANSNARANAITTYAHAAQIRNAMTALAQHDAGRPASERIPTVALAVCHDCSASHTLVRVLLRNQHHGSPLPTFRLYADQTWPALDTLARHTRSTIEIVDQLATRVRVTPAALSLTHEALAVGVTDVVALITTRISTTRVGTSRGRHQ